MTNYKCPYCGQDSYAKSSKKSGKYSDWKTVRQHLARCKLNTNEFTICVFYGPISIATINSYTSLNEFRQAYPKWTLDHSIYKYLRQTKGLEAKPLEWSAEECIKAIQQFYLENKKLPETRDFSKTDFKYPSHKMLQTHFGSWNKAIEAAGFAPNIQNGFGIDTYGKDGNLYRSSHEAYFADNFLFEKYTYQYELPYGNGWKYDFYIKELNLYIELDGGLRPQRIEEKRKYHLTHGVNCSIIKTQDIYKKDYNLQRSDSGPGLRNDGFDSQ